MKSKIDARTIQDPRFQTRPNQVPGTKKTKISKLQTKLL